MDDPILEEMTRVKSPTDIKESRYRDWCDYLRVQFAAHEDAIASLRAQLDKAVKRG